MQPVLAIALAAAQPAMAQDSEATCEPDLERVAGLTGVWLVEGGETDLNGRELPGAPPLVAAMKLLGLEAPWNDEGWVHVDNDGFGLPTDGIDIKGGWGFPVMMSAPAPFTIVVAPSQTVMVSDYRDVRYVFTDGRSHTPDDERWATIWGESIGCWEGDTLVVDTVSVKFSPEYTTASPPLSENARFVERLRMTGPDRLESDVTITDPERLERPWIVHLVYRRHPTVKQLVHEGHILENNRTVIVDGALTIAAPEAEALPAASQLQVAQVSAAEIDRLAGAYQIEGAPLVMTVKRQSSRLLVRVDPVQPFFVPFYPASPTRFLNRGNASAFIEFIADDSGTITGLRGAGPDGAPYTAKRTSP